MAEAMSCTLRRTEFLEPYKGLRQPADADFAPMPPVLAARMKVDKLHRASTYA